MSVASFGHEAESREGGGIWKIVAVATDEEEKWRYLSLAGPAGGWASFFILQNRRGQYYWTWLHHELGYVTKMEARRSFASRALCLQSLWDAMHSTRAFGELIEDMQVWETQ